MTPFYFSGSISGGRDDVALYAKIVDALEEAGFRPVTRHVADPSVTAEGETLDARGICARDLGWIEEAARGGGFMVAEVSTPSLGVGYEIAVARYVWKMPVIALWRPGRTSRCSAMIAGDPAVRYIEYSEDRLEEMLHEIVSLAPGLVERDGH